MKLGIVGLPNVGKSTLFNAITGTANAQAANYPFCTIEPNTGIVAVPDERLDKLADYWQTDKKTPAVVEFTDIAGLVKGASKGAGLGNKFLGHIRECDAIIHVVRCFDNDEIMHVVEDATKAVDVDPQGDMECIDLELIYADLDMIENRLQKAIKAGKGGNKEAREEEAFLNEIKAHLEGGANARTFEYDEKNELYATVMKEMGLLSAKPVIYACNMDDDGCANPEDVEYYRIVKAKAESEGAQVLPICAKTEEELAGLEEDEKALFLEDIGFSESGLDRLIKASYRLLGLISYLTDGKKECRAWTIKAGTKAPQAAGKIHSDFERGFIRAQVIAYDDLAEADFDYQAVKAKGKQRTEGKEYVVNDGDIIEFLFNV
ncbi:MAG: redox-regulated ATPase YchF [Lachnospiraceae bacterium]|nr:redox-regulated ATPase YchF [Lachnospiraceae bacterium]